MESVVTDARKIGPLLLLLLLFLGVLSSRAAEPVASRTAPERSAPIRRAPNVRVAHPRPTRERTPAPRPPGLPPLGETPEVGVRLDRAEMHCLVREKVSESTERLLGLIDAGVSDATRAEMRVRLLALMEAEQAVSPQGAACGWIEDLEEEITHVLCVDGMRDDSETAGRLDALGLCDALP